MARGVWHLWSSRERGQLNLPERIERLPKGAEICGGGNWAELRDKDGIERVFVRITGQVELASARKVA